MYHLFSSRLMTLWLHYRDFVSIPPWFKAATANQLILVPGSPLRLQAVLSQSNASFTQMFSSNVPYAYFLLYYVNYTCTLQLFWCCFFFTCDKRTRWKHSDLQIKMYTIFFFWQKKEQFDKYFGWTIIFLNIWPGRAFKGSDVAYRV